MRQSPLFVLAPENLILQAAHRGHDGWSLRVCMRRQGQSWDDAVTTDYSHLSTSELLDVLCAESASQLGIS